jgi:isopenicillin N synthase-like dioxygenase
MGSDKNGDQPNQWLPDEVLPGFRAFMTRFYWDCFSVTSDIMRALAVGIGLEDEDHLLKKHSGHNNQLRLLHYPEVPLEALERQTVSRMPAHSDWSSITILFQDDCGGLEAEDPSQPGRYIPATPLKNAIVMNVGDLLQMWSNGYFLLFFFCCSALPSWTSPAWVITFLTRIQITSDLQTIESRSHRCLQA